MNFRKIFYCITGAVLVSAGCKKMVQVDEPITSPNSATVYENAIEAAAVLTGIYGRMSTDAANGFVQGRQAFTIGAGLAADELRTYTNVGVWHNAMYQNTADVSVVGMWRDMYKHIYVANAALEGLVRSTELVDSIKNQLIGEAKFIRGFLYFYIANIWGDAPLIVNTDYKVNVLSGRTPVATIYDTVIADLIHAKALLSNNWLTPGGANTAERLRPNKAAATAMLARAYLYMKQYGKAETEASELISNPKLALATLANMFRKESTESIWSMSSTSPGINSQDGNVFLKTSAPSATEPVSLNPWMRDIFETGDNRKTGWIDSVTIATVKYYYPKKYKVKGIPATTPVTEWLVVLRLGEQYLIRAEARANLGNYSGVNSAESDVNAIRTRAGLADTTAASQEEMISIIENERRVEFMCEMGHRWLDLKRLGRMDAVMPVVSPLKGGTWSPNWKLWPIPKEEMQQAPNLKPQNPGYPF